MEASEQREFAAAMWAAGEYDEIANHIWGVGADLVGRVGIGNGDNVLDVACGTGNASLPAAQAGARVTGLDLTPRLLEQGRRRAADAGVEIDFVEGDAEQLPFDDANFDVVLSTFGCMFAPRHEVAAAEIARVLRPGGRVGIAAWTPDGNIGEFFRCTSALAPPPPADYVPPVSWGSREHVQGLFAGTGVEPRFEDTEVVFNFDSIDDAVDEYYDKFGPLLTLRAALEAEGRDNELRAALRDFFERANTAGGASMSYPGEYLVTLGEKSG